MAVALAANLAVLTTLDRLLFRPLPYQSPDQLVQIHLGSVTDQQGQEFPVLFGELTALFQTRASTLAGVAIAEGTIVSVETEPDGPLPLTGVTYNSLEVLGIRPHVGRDFTSSDSNNPAAPAVLLTFDVWRSRFGSTTDLSTLHWKSRVDYHVVGVLPRDFVLPSSRLLARYDGVYVMTSTRHLAPGMLTVAPFARLAPGVTPVVAEQELDTLARNASWGSSETRNAYLADVKRISVINLQRGLTALSGPNLWIAAYAPWLIVAIACVNVSLLLLVRERLRSSEFFIRIALGARPMILVWYVARDIGRLCATAVVLALVAGWGGHGWVRAIAPPFVRTFVVEDIDVRLAAITALIASSAALIASLLPIAFVYRTNRLAPQGGASGRLPLSRALATFGFIAGQACFGTVGVFGAVSTVPHFIEMLVGSRGFEQEGLYTLRTGHGAPSPDEDDVAGLPERVRAVLEQVRNSPGVASAAASLALPIGPQLGMPLPLIAGGLKGYQFAVSDGFFETLATPMIAGRTFSERDVRDRNAVVIVNREAVKKLYPRQDPKNAVGQILRTVIGTRTIVGVSDNIVSWPGAAIVPSFFVPISATEVSSSSSQLSISVRARDKTFAPLVIRRRLDAALGTGRGFGVEYVPSTLAAGLDRPRFMAVLLGALAGIGILLNAVGLHSIATLEVASRRHEIAVRLALGSSRLRLVRPISGPAIVAVSSGVSAGFVVVSLGFAWLSSLAVSQSTPLAWLVTIGIVLISSGTALIGPILRCDRREIFPILRAELF